MIGPHLGSARTPVGAAPYGAAELRALAPRHTAQALAVAAFIYVGFFGSVVLLQGTSVAQPAPRGRIVFDHFPPPPSVPPAAAVPQSAARSPKVTTGTPTPIPEVQAPPEATRPANDLASAPLEGQGEGQDGAAADGSSLGPIEPVTPLAPPLPPEPIAPPAPKPPPVPEVLEIAAVMPQVLDAPVPVYPPMARQAGVEGRVILRVRVGRDGSARAVTLVRSDNELLDAAAREAVSRWRFRPGMQDGQPVDVWMTIPIRFRLRERR